MQVGFQNQGPVNQPMNLTQQIGAQQAMANVMFPRDRVPRRHVEAYQQVLVGYFKRKQKNPQAHGYRCSLHPGVFQSIDFPQGT